MIAILEQLHMYVPISTQTKEEGNGNSAFLNDYNFHRILVGGDQLTAARCQGSTAACGDHGTSLQRLQGLVTVSEDWHSKQTFLMVCTWFMQYT